MHMCYEMATGYMILDSTLAHGPILPDDVAITDLLDQHDAEVSFEVSHNFTEIMIMLAEWVNCIPVFLPHSVSLIFL